MSSKNCVKNTKIGRGIIDGKSMIIKGQHLGHTLRKTAVNSKVLSRGQVVLKLKPQVLDPTFYFWLLLRFLGEDMPMNRGVERHVFLTDMSSIICVRKRKQKKEKKKKERKKERREGHLNSENDLPIFQLNE